MKTVLLFLLFLVSVFADQKKICLSMVVKNDEDLIVNCLESVKGFIDYISIADLGSNDNTVQLIKEFMEQHGIPGKIHHFPWKNCGFNKTQALQAAQKTLRESGFYLPDCYLLVLDTHMKLETAMIQKENLAKEAYLALYKMTPFSSYTPVLLLASLPWESVGVAQEYWSCKVPHTTEKLGYCFVHNQENARRKRARAERTIKLLTQGLKTEPENRHYFFGLGEAFKSLEKYLDAISWYRAALEKEEDKEEVWYTKYMLGECYEKLGQWEAALQFYLDAYQALPDRADTLRKIATHYRYRGQNDLAYLFAHHASFIEPKQEWMSFISDSLKYEINEEISIAAYYTPFREEGFFAADQILLQKNAPWNQKEQAFKNLLFYIQNLKNAEFKKVEIDLPLIREGEEAYYNPMNPSIYRTDQGYKLICRAVNFTLKNGVYTSLDPEDGVIRTRNFLIHYDQDFKLLSQNEIVETAPRMKVEPLWRIEGFEDCRLFAFDQGDWFTCTTFDTNPTGVCQISLCKLENEPKGKQIQVEKLVALKGPDSNRYEKNWLPFVKENQLLMLYSYMPFIINKPNIETGEWEPVLQYELNFDFSRFRGSAGPIPFDRGYLVLIHEVFMRTENERCYLHRFIYLDQDFMIKKISLPFTFQHVGVEYCCSMTLDHTGTKLIMPIGIEDREAYLCTIDLDTVRALLQDL